MPTPADHPSVAESFPEEISDLGVQMTPAGDPSVADSCPKEISNLGTQLSSVMSICGSPASNRPAPTPTVSPQHVTSGVSPPVVSFAPVTPVPSSPVRSAGPSTLTPWKVPPSSLTALGDYGNEATDDNDENDENERGTDHGSGDNNDNNYAMMDAEDDNYTTSESGDDAADGDYDPLATQEDAGRSYSSLHFPHTHSSGPSPRLCRKHRL